MTHAAFIIPAYAVTVGGLLAILLQILSLNKLVG